MKKGKVIILRKKGEKKIVKKDPEFIEFSGFLRKKFGLDKKTNPQN
jgi:hypothetical protein